MHAPVARPSSATYIHPMQAAHQHGVVAIYPLQYVAADLQAAPEEEAVSFLMCGQLQNDIVILMRQVLQAKIVDSEAEPLRLAAATAAMLNMRMLAARLSEGWKLIKDSFQLNFRAYGSDIDQDAKDDLVWLKPYFSGTNLVHTIRNKAVSHFDREVALEGYRKLSPNEPMIDLHALAEGNTIYFSGEALMLSSLHHLTGIEDVMQALDQIGDEIIDVARRLGNVVRAYLKAFSQRYLASQLNGLRTERILIEKQPRLSAFAAPVYLARARNSDLAHRLLGGASPLAINWFLSK
jgi:hypothetical protein